VATRSLSSFSLAPRGLRTLAAGLAAACLAALPGGLPETASALDTGWSYSFGTSARRVGVSFDLGPPQLVSTAGAYTVQAATGLGDVGVMTAPGQVITYADGSVGPDAANDGRGNASFTVAGAGQVVYGTRNPGDDFTIPGSVTFTSSGTTYAYAETFAATPSSQRQSETIVNPYAEVRHALIDVAGLSVDFSLGWAFLRSRQQVQAPTGAITVVETASVNQYTYVYDFPAEAGDVPPGFPPTFDNTDFFGVIYDADAYNTWAGLDSSDPHFVRNPTTTVISTPTATPIALISANSAADLDLGVNVLPMMIDGQWRVTPWLAVRFGAGPTLNVVSYRLHEQTDWFVNGAYFTRRSETNRGTQVSIGASTRTTVAIALTPDGHWAMELGGGYDFVPAHTVTAGNARAKIDLSSWVTTAGFSVRF
jgi:hypothetical protein